MVQVECLRAAVGGGTAVVALSGGVDSSVVTMLGHRALGSRLTAYFIENGIMRAGEPQTIVAAFKRLGVRVQLVDAKAQFFKALKGITDPEAKRNAITHTFYKTVFGPLVKKSGAKHLLQGTIYTDVEETMAGIKRQHNVLAQLGIDTKKVYGYQVLEPVIELRKTGVRTVGKALGLPMAIYQRPPFPGPALAARVIGEVTPERDRDRARGHDDRGVGPGQDPRLPVSRDPPRGSRHRHPEGEAGVRVPNRGPLLGLHRRRHRHPDPAALAHAADAGQRITTEVEGVVSVTYNIASKPPSTIEAV